MTSSVARMPPSDEWRDPVRLSSDVFGSRGGSPFSPARLHKVFVHRPQSSDVPSSSFSPSASSSSSSSYSSSSPSAAVVDSVAGNEEAGKRQSKIMDRWAARQARKMVKTIERHADVALVSALTTTSQLIPSRARSLVRDASPMISESPSGGAADFPSSGAGNVGRGVRASSLIQMWRELESEGGLTPRNLPASSGGSMDIVNAAGFSPEEASRINDTGLDEPGAFGEWSSDTTTAAHSEPANCSSLLNESEKGRVGNIVKMLTSPNSASSLEYENKWFGRESPRPNKLSRRENMAIKDKAESTHMLGLSQLRLRKRRDMKDFIARMEEERRRELVTLAERQCISRFGYRGRLQSMLRLRSLRRQIVTDQEQLRRPSTTPVPDQFQDGASISLLRKRFNQREHDSNDSKSAISIQVQFSIDVEESSCTLSNDQFTSENNQYQETVSPTDLESTRETNSPLSRSDDLQEGNCNSHGAWEERNLWLSSLNWHRPTTDSSPSNGWQGEAVIQGLASHSPQNVGSWTDEPSNSRRRSRVRRQPVCHDLFQKFADNVEIMDLLERRPVSTSLESDFSEQMNQMILSFLHKRETQSFNDGFAKNYEDHSFWNQNNEYQDTEKTVPVSPSLVIVHYHTMHQRAENCQQASYAHQSSQDVDMKTLQELRSNLADIRGQISELRKLVQGYMESHNKLQDSIKQDILDALRQSFGTGVTLHYSGKLSGRKDRCTICCEMQVDTLFYKCGHMCTCFRCANGLQHSSSRCPICQSPIVDVVRASPTCNNCACLEPALTSKETHTSINLAEFN